MVIACPAMRALHDEPEFSPYDRHAIRARIRRLNDLGFAVDEIQIEPAKVLAFAKEPNAQTTFRLTG